MADITMPKMGFDMTEGTIVRWLKKVGDDVKKGDAIAEIETDKVTIEIEAFDSGKLTQIVADEGTVVPVGTPIAVLDGPAAAPAGTSAPVNGATQAADAQPPQSALATAESDVSSGASKPAAQFGDMQDLRPGYGSDEQPEDFVPGAPEMNPTGSPRGAVGDDIEPGNIQLGANGPVFASPMAKRLAREQNLQLQAIPGTGPGGRIVRKDVEAFAQQKPTAAPAPQAAPRPAAQPAAPAPSAAPAPQPAPVARPAAAGTRREPLSRLRQTIARRLVQSKGPVPHFYVSSEIDMGALMELRKQLNATAETRITVNDFIVKAAAQTLKQFPVLNASYAEDALEYHDAINISIAVATDNGLLAPAVTDADKKSLGTLSSEAKELIERTRTGKATPDELGRGTFTVSNLGMYPVENFVAIINPPQAAILAVGAVREMPVVRDGQIVVGQIMKATISVDHRVADGAVAAQYMQALKKILEHPMLILI
ncbi:MAG: 2-oxo acid dehydrogenase subunit E2 [Herpetosiphonaceae bacterium]|nr:2-oxo acid dehydrogenase subunit E2 [Herpetosiphonaceae bacterium]